MQLIAGRPRRGFVAGAGQAGVVLGLLIVCHGRGSAEVCDSDRYGTSSQAVAIEDALVDGSVMQAVAAIRTAQRTRGNRLGCPETEQRRVPPDTTAISAAAVRASWAAQLRSPNLAAYAACPPLGREMGAHALALVWAREAGVESDSSLVDDLVERFIAVQHVPAKTPGEFATWPGLYGYSERYGRSSDACFIGGTVAESVSNACASSQSSLCSTYRTGQFAGQRFAVADFSRSPRITDGGAAFDHGWAGVLMAHASVGVSSEAGSARRESLRAAADWAAAEPAVRNHNYTAKLAWLLAAAYDLLGEPRWRMALVDKLERSILPGVLMDIDADGIIDGVPGVRFAELVAPAARVPGRMWDAHNSRREYQAMNAWALAAAYGAFRDRRDTALATRVRPFALAALDNLATETLALGAPETGASGASQPPIALLIGLRIFVDGENVARPDWQRALAAYWNAGAMQPGDGSKSPALALLLQRVSGLAWRSLAEQSAHYTASGIAGAWYEPTRSGEGLIVFPYSDEAAFLSWFTYDAVDPTRQVWLYGAGPFSQGRIEVGTLFRTDGTRFGNAFDPAAVRMARWGSATFELTSCRSARLSYASADPEYGSGTRSIVKLLGVAQSGCP